VIYVYPGVRGPKQFSERNYRENVPTATGFRRRTEVIPSKRARNEAVLLQTGSGNPLSTA
jgi:hypothetical protein